MKMNAASSGKKLFPFRPSPKTHAPISSLRISQTGKPCMIHANDDWLALRKKPVIAQASGFSYWPIIFSVVNRRRYKQFKRGKPWQQNRLTPIFRSKKANRQKNRITPSGNIRIKCQPVFAIWPANQLLAEAVSEWRPVVSPGAVWQQFRASENIVRQMNSRQAHCHAHSRPELFACP